MNFYNGLDFICNGISLDCKAFHERTFNGYYGIQYSENGFFSVEIEGYKRTVSGPWALITSPGPLFRYGALPDQKRLHAFTCFKGPRVDEYVKSGFLPVTDDGPLIKINRSERFLETLKLLIRVAKNPSGTQHARAVHTLEDLILQLHEQGGNNPVPKYLQHKFDEISSRISRNPELHWDFEFEAETAGMSYVHFRRLFKQYTGMPPGTFLLRAKLNKAAEMLTDSDEQIAAIAAKCGFNDQFYFSRQFSKQYHFSPLKYRMEFGSPAS